MSLAIPRRRGSARRCASVLPGSAHRRRRFARCRGDPRRRRGRARRARRPCPRCSSSLPRPSCWPVGFALLRPSRVAAWAIAGGQRRRGRRVGAHPGHRDQLDRRPAGPRGAAVRRRGVRRARCPRRRRRARGRPHRLAARRDEDDTSDRHGAVRPPSPIIAIAALDGAGDARRRHIRPRQQRRSGRRARPRLGTLGRLRSRAATPTTQHDHGSTADTGPTTTFDESQPHTHDANGNSVAIGDTSTTIDESQPHNHDANGNSVAVTTTPGELATDGTPVRAWPRPWDPTQPIDVAGVARRDHRAGGPGHAADPGHARRPAEVRRSRPPPWPTATPRSATAAPGRSTTSSRA